MEDTVITATHNKDNTQQMLATDSELKHPGWVEVLVALQEVSVLLAIIIIQGVSVDIQINQEVLQHHQVLTNLHSLGMEIMVSVVVWTFIIKSKWTHLATFAQDSEH